MPSKSYRQQVRMSPETRARIADLAALWAGSDGVPLTPSAVVRVCVERAYQEYQETGYTVHHQAVGR